MNMPAGGEGNNAAPATSGDGKGFEPKMTVYEILVTRGKRKRAMASKEDPFERIERQLRAAKRFRVEEYIRSLATDGRVDEDEQRKRYAFFFGGDRSSSGSSALGASLATPPHAGPPAPPPRTTSLTAGPSPPPLVAQTALTRGLVGQQAAAAVATSVTRPSALFALPATMRLHPMSSASGAIAGRPVVGSLGLPSTAASCCSLRSLYPPSRPNILATASPSPTNGLSSSSSPEASPGALATLSSPVSSPVVHSPRGPPVAQSSAPSASATAAVPELQPTSSRSSSSSACCCSPSPTSPLPSGGWVSPTTASPTKRTAGSSSQTPVPCGDPAQQPAPASGMCD